MNIWVKSLVTGAVVSIAVFFLSEKLKKEKPTRKYSIEYIIKAEPDKKSVPSFSLPKIISVLEKRLQAADYEYKIKKNGETTINVSLSGMEDTLSPYRILTANHRVQFRELYNLMEVVEMLKIVTEEMQQLNKVPAKKIIEPEKKDTLSRKSNRIIRILDSAKEQENIKSSLLIEFSIPYQESNGANFSPPEIGKVKLKDTATVGKLFRDEKVKRAAPSDMLICFGEARNNKNKFNEKKDQFFSLYCLRTGGSPETALLENEDISDARTDFDMNGKPEIGMQFNKAGSRKWAAMTRQNIGRSIAIIINGSVVSAPNVLSAIEDGASSISGDFTISECDLISIGLKSRKLPATLTITSSILKQENSGAETTKKLLMILIIFTVFSGLAFFIFKTLKPI